MTTPPPDGRTQPTRSNSPSDNRISPIRPVDGGNSTARKSHGGGGRGCRKKRKPILHDVVPASVECRRVSERLEQRLVHLGRAEDHLRHNVVALIGFQGGNRRVMRPG